MTKLPGFQVPTSDPRAVGEMVLAVMAQQHARCVLVVDDATAMMMGEYARVLLLEHRPADNSSVLQFMDYLARRYLATVAVSDDATARN